MKIAIIGSGNIGSALGNLWSRTGHQIVFGSEHPQQVHVTTGRAVAVTEAIAFGEVVAVTIPFGAWPSFAKTYAESLTGKVVLDTTNPNRERDGAIVDEVTGYSGTLKFVASLLPGARLVKAFNTMESHTLRLGAEQPEGRLAHPLAGDDLAALAVAARLVEDAGFDAVRIGDAATAATFDQGTPVWNHPRSAADLRKALELKH